MYLCLKFTFTFPFDWKGIFSLFGSPGPGVRIKIRIKLILPFFKILSFLLGPWKKWTLENQNQNPWAGQTGNWDLYFRTPGQLRLRFLSPSFIFIFGPVAEAVRRSPGSFLFLFSFLFGPVAQTFRLGHGCFFLFLLIRPLAQIQIQIQTQRIRFRFRFRPSDWILLFLIIVLFFVLTRGPDG